MTSTIPTSPSFSILSFNPTITNTPSQFPPNLPLRLRHRRLTVKAHSSNSPVIHHLKNIAGAAVFAAATATAALTFSPFPARAEPPPTLTEVLPETEIETETDTALAGGDTDTGITSPLSEFLETNYESSSPEALKSLLQQKLDLGEDEEALKILKHLISSQPEVSDWKFLAARLTTEIGDTDSARSFYDEILKSNPLSFEALFENALLMDRCGEGDALIEQLEDAMRVALEDNKEKEGRDVRLIIAQILFLRKSVDEALGLYEILIKEDPNDFRPYFCRGVIYTLLDKNDEAKEQFAKYRELSPKKFEVDGYLRTPLSKIKDFGTDQS
ncbi:protein SLOW GREEN 1, chloroplastic [Vicia villosa]|uniref:protein SLOW GREEN 1, chloroplastic n=1 Tax=Vicia villosa TaxID=3911 RepID=UPI00273B0308|nr:protein SLOW GREEN 1, chloroplastic [Vicia villosa]